MSGSLMQLASESYVENSNEQMNTTGVHACIRLEKSNNFYQISREIGSWDVY